MKSMLLESFIRNFLLILEDKKEEKRRRKLESQLGQYRTFLSVFNG